MVKNHPEPVLPFRLPNRADQPASGRRERRQRSNPVKENGARSLGQARLGTLQAGPGSSLRLPLQPPLAPRRSERSKAKDPNLLPPDQPAPGLDRRGRQARGSLPQRQASQPAQEAGLAALPSPLSKPDAAAVGEVGRENPLAGVSQERRELVCSLIALLVKLGLVAVSAASLVQLAGAYQRLMDRNGEIMAVLELEQAQLARARDRFDRLFMVEGEQRLLREQSQWIAPNRIRVIWQASPAPAQSPASPPRPSP